jgi:uncharacterized protein YjiS (DUF1127 family)
MYLSNLIRAFAAWRRYRSAVQQLADLDDRTLADIGLNRTQIRHGMGAEPGRLTSRYNRYANCE